ncbi:putative aminotransferase family protein [Xylariaceae sp. AK1471]|nr:putative aminotransferase family protein [Xylariaceae sp. AK1471]
MTAPTPSGPSVPFGRAMRHAHFAFSPAYTPLNHGSYGTYPVSVRGAHAALQSEVEAAPDRFISLDWASRLKESRALAAGLLNCLTEDLVFVPNATTGVDTVLKNIPWEKGDVVLVYEIVYDSVRSELEWLEEMFGVRVEVVDLHFPVGDEELVEAVVGACKRINSNTNPNEEGGKGRERVRLAIVDTIVSMPGIRIPFEKLVPRLQAEGALVLVDGAHGIGHVDMDLTTLKPDFFVTNLHKWLFVPRGCAAFFVPKRHQGVIRTSLPTSYRFRRRGGEGEEDGNAFVELFDFTATLDMTNFLTVKAALDFRTQVCGGEETIRIYSQCVARQGGIAAASILGTEIMEIAGSCMLDCNFVNVRLPLELTNATDNDNDESGVREARIDPKHAKEVVLWFKTTGVQESGCYFQTCVYRSKFWWRLSGTIYLDVEDFTKGAEVLKGLCERAGRGEYLS